MIYNGHHGRLDDIRTTVHGATEALRPFRDRFGAIVVTGMSGVLVGSPVAIRLHRDLVVIRKPHDDSHDHRDVISHSTIGRGTPYLFLDDLISLGRTYARVRARMQAHDIAAEYAGTYLYANNVLSWDDDNDSWAKTLRGYTRRFPPPPQQPPFWPLTEQAADFTTIAVAEGLPA